MGSNPVEILKSFFWGLKFTTQTLDTCIRHFHMSHNPIRVGGQPVEEMYGIMTKISSVSSQNQLLMLKNAPEFTKIMIGEICTSL